MKKLSPTQLHSNAEALHALADGKQIEYYSPVLAKWCDCEDVCMEFEHRIKPEQEPAHKEQAPVSLRVEDY